MYRIGGTSIILTRGDTLNEIPVVIKNADGSEYIPDYGDHIRFAMKKSYSDDEPLILKEIPTDSLLLTINPEDTKQLDFGDYVYDMELTTKDGVVCTFITKGKFKITEEVH